MPASNLERALGALVSKGAGGLLRATEQALGALLLRRFESRCRDATAVNVATLRNTLQTDQSTRRGLEFDFEGMAQSEKLEFIFRKRMPLTTYADYAEDIERVVRGEMAGLGGRPVHSFAISSGTTGRPKRIPTSARRQVEMVCHMACMLPFVAERNLREQGAAPTPSGHRDVNLMSMAGTQERTASGARVGSGSAGGIQSVQPLIDLLWTSPVGVFRLEDQRKADYLHALFALRERNVRSVQAIFAPHVVRWIQVMQRNADQLVHDLEHGTLDPGLELTEAERRSFEARLAPDPSRAAEVREALEGPNHGLLARLWPSLGYVGTCVTGSFALYAETLRGYAGDVALYSPTYGASEALVGMNLGMQEANRYVLSAGHAYYEFIPFADVEQAQPRTVGPGQLTPGQRYEVVVTNDSGFYRYRLGDVVTCVGYHHQAPVLQFEYRRGTQLNVVGEKTSERQTAQAIEDWASEWLGCRVRDYTTTVDTDGPTPRYAFYVELEVADGVTEAEVCEAARGLDEALRKANPRYDGYARKPHRLAAPRLTVVASGAFEHLHRALMARTCGQNRNQVKVPRRLQNPDLQGVLDDCISVSATPPASVFPPPAIAQDTPRRRTGS